MISGLGTRLRRSSRYEWARGPSDGASLPGRDLPRTPTPEYPVSVLVKFADSGASGSSHRQRRRWPGQRDHYGCAGNGGIGVVVRRPGFSAPFSGSRQRCQSVRTSGYLLNLRSGHPGHRHFNARHARAGDPPCGRGHPISLSLARCRRAAIANAPAISTCRPQAARALTGSRVIAAASVIASSSLTAA